MTETRPLVAVVSSTLRVGRGSMLGPHTWRRTHRYELMLACGHTVDRYAHPDVHRTTSPPPKRARCDECSKEKVT